MSSSSHSFPADLLPDLLSRLPAKVLLKFKFVSKSWLSIIEDPKFSSVHVNRQPTSSIAQVCLCKLNTDVKKLCEINWSGGIDGVVVEEFCSVPNLDFTRLVGSSNGVLCILCRINDKGRIMIWNPLSRKYQIIPHVPPRPDRSTIDPVYCGYGFGYDKVNDDYKILCFDWGWTTRALVYSRKKNTWRTIDYELPTISAPAMGVLFEGALHWISIIHWSHENDSSLIVFDLAKEEFISYTVSVPEKVHDVDLFLTRDGRVCMKILMGKGSDIRLMVNYHEWVEVRFEPEGDDKPKTDVHPKSLVPIAYVESPILMNRMNKGSKLVFYDVEEHSFICNGRVSTIINGIVGHEVVPYIQTLELL